MLHTLCDLLKPEAEIREQYWIAYYDSVNQGYNATYGGIGSLGLHPSYETRKKMSESGLGKRKNRPDQSKRVLQFTNNNQFLKEYISVAEASRQTGVHKGHIAECCRGKLKSAGGYIWKLAS